MKWFSWEHLFRPAILKRGRAYFEEGCVDVIWQEGSAIEAEVTGSEVYHVSLQLHDDCLETWSCTCPYAADGTPCKHLAAVCYALTEGMGGSKKPAGAAPTLAELADRISPAKLRALVLELAENDPWVADRLRLLAASLTAKDRKSYEKKLDQILRRARDRDGFIPYEWAWETMQKYGEVLEQVAEQFLAAGLTWDAFLFTCHGFSAAAADENSMDDSDGGLMMLRELCLSLWKDQVKEASPEDREKMYHWFDQTWQPCLLTFYQEVLWQAQVSLFREPVFLQKSLARADQLIAAMQTASQQGELAEAVLTRLALMEALGASPEEKEHFLEPFQNLYQIRRRRVEISLAAGRWQEAEDLLQQSKSLDSNWPGLVSQYSRQLIDLYREHQQEEAFGEELRFQVFRCMQGDLHYLRLLKQKTSPEQWPAVREELLVQPTIRYVKKKFLAAEGLYDRLLAQVTAGGFLQDLDNWAPTLQKHLPDQVRQAYEEVLQREMRVASDRKQYARLIAHLRKLGTDANGKARAAALADHWRQAYPRRRSMLDELQKAGY